MYIIALIVIVLILFLLFYCLLGREWYSPCSLFTIPFLLMFIISAFNQSKWSFVMSFETFFVFVLGILAFLIGAFVCNISRIRTQDSIVLIQKKESLSTLRLLFVIFLEALFFFMFLVFILRWGASHGYSLSVSIYQIMMAGKFNLDEDTIQIPFVLSVCLQMNYTCAYLFSYLIARRFIFHDNINLPLLIIGFLLSCATCLLGGSRGPIIENILAIIISTGIVFYQKSGKRFFNKKTSLIIFGLLASIILVFFFAMPLMGRSTTNSDFIEEIELYFGAQAFNLNYFITNIDTRSSFFGANTFSSFYSDVQNFTGINFGAVDGKVLSFFVTSNNINLGNVFTCFFAYYADFGFLGVAIVPFFVGLISQFVFKKAKGNVTTINFWAVLYLFISVNLFFSFFSNRFFQNIINLKMVINIFWILLMYYLIFNPTIYFSNQLTTKRINSVKR